MFPRRYHSRRRCLSIRLHAVKVCQTTAGLGFHGPESIVVESIEARVVRIRHGGAQLGEGASCRCAVWE